jgi:16S rRNA (cytosine967-C5)-methyltransferase
MERPGLASVKAARAAVRAHLAVQKGEPLRAAVSDALAEAKALGGKERRFVVVAVRGLSRHQRLLDAAARRLGYPPSGFLLAEDRALVRWVLWRRLFTGATWKVVAPEVRLPGPVRPRTVGDRILEEVASADLPPGPEESFADPVERAAARHSFPTWLSRALAAQVGDARVDALFAALNEEPDLFVRVRPPGTREAVRAELATEGVDTHPVEWAPDAVRLRGGGMKVFDTQAMRKGRLQVQEPGSQLIAQLCAVRGHEVRRALDYCAGAGGKTLALADLLGKGAVVEAHDASARRLGEARRRVKAWSLSQVRFAAEPAVEQADVVLVDAPCSGTGSLAREPEQKWRLTPEKVRGFVATQRKILDGLGPRMRVGARLVYATCSLLREENEAVVEAFVAAHPGWAVQGLGGEVPDEVEEGGFLRVWPDRAGAGGFFAARLVRER